MRHALLEVEMREQMSALVEHFRKAGVDVYMYAGPIERSGYDRLCELLEEKDTAPKALLYLITAGGSPNAGYRIARALCHHYGVENFRVAIPADCKSAGTLVCIGAHSLVFFDKGELGPLDVQVQKPDEIFEQSSGLDILRGMTYLRQEALDTFRDFLLDINRGSGLSTKTASEIASKLVIGLFEPMFAQIDPMRLGEMNAALQIADEYGSRLVERSKSLKAGALVKLINSYPTHGFVIDRAEARKLFERVDPPTRHEAELGEVVLKLNAGKLPRTRSKVLDILSLLKEALVKENEDDGSAAAPEPEGSSPEGAEPPTGATGTDATRSA